MCAFSLKFLSQNYNTLKGELTVMKKQCLVNGVSSPSPHGSLGVVHTTKSLWLNHRIDMNGKYTHMDRTLGKSQFDINIDYIKKKSQLFKNKKKTIVKSYL